MISPWMIDLVIAGIAFELVVLVILLRQRHQSRWSIPLFWFLLSGALLMVAIRLAVSGEAATGLAAALIASFVTHALFLVTAWQGIKKPGP